MRTIDNCRSCGSTKLKTIIDLGEQYLSDFRRDDRKPPQYPLEVVFCEDCKLVQLRHTTPPEQMYHERYGFKSGISDSIKADLKEIVKEGLQTHHEAESWLDIASNDGTLLGFVPESFYRVGCDPIPKLCLEAKYKADRIVKDFFKPTDYAEHSFDIVSSISMFYDLDDPNEFVSGVDSIMADKAVWIIQQNYLLTTMQLGAIDNICHEHLEYYTLLSLESLLERHGLEVFRVSTSMVNGGSIRTFVARRGDYPVEKSVLRQRRMEAIEKIERASTYVQFGIDAGLKINHLREYIGHLVEQNARIYIIAASTRGSTIWQACGFGPEQIVAAIERNPAKVGSRFSAIGVPIISERQARIAKPDYILIGPWFFADEILEREKDMIDAGTKAIIPLPRLRIV